MSRRICRLEDIPDGEGLGFSLDLGEAGCLAAGHAEIFVVRQGDRAYCYANCCPHLSSPLDWVENQFMTPDKTHIMCATHGARFRIVDGLCVFGPCEGGSLTALPVSVRRGNVVLNRPDGPESRP